MRKSLLDRNMPGGIVLCMKRLSGDFYYVPPKLPQFNGLIWVDTDS